MAGRSIHLAGMGVMGSMIAWQLQGAGIDFTWHDRRSPVNAWVASTGSVAPSGDETDNAAYREWLALAEAPPWGGQLGPVVEAASYWYTSKGMPHGVKGHAAEDLGHVRRATHPSVHLNPQSFVLGTRARFSAHERAWEPGGALVVQAHGFNARLDRVLWGWSATAAISGDARLFAHGRPCIYARTGLYQFAYLYPRPGTDRWYVGSALIAQKSAKRLETAPKIARAVQFLHQTTGGLIQVEDIQDVREGWRPVAADGDTAWTRWAGETLLVRPGAHSGVRWAPRIARAVLEELKRVG